MSKKRIRARIMWAYKDTLNGTKPDEIHGIWTYKSELHSESEDFQPIIVLPATAEAYEQMVEQGAIALNTKSSLGQSWLGLRECSRKYFRDESSVVLRAIGITPPKKGRKCSDGQCVKHRNIDGGCDLCGVPSL